MKNSLKSLSIKKTNVQSIKINKKKFDEHKILKSYSVKLCERFYNFENKILFTPTKINHINFKENITLSDLKGEAFLRTKINDFSNSSILKNATNDEIEKANIFAFGGIDCDSPRNLSALLRCVENLINCKSSNNYEKFTHNCVTIFPEVSKQERYDAAVNYSIDPTYCPPYIISRVEKYILPKIYDEDTFFNSFRPITLFSHSLGGREIMMIENALKIILKTLEPNINDDLIDNLFSSFRAICLGYAINVEVLAEQKQGFSKLIIFSLDDIGVLRPKNFYDNVLSSLLLKDKSYQICKFKELSQENNNYLIALGKNQLPHQIKNKIMPSDHSLPQYEESIKHLPIDLQIEIANWISGASQDFNEDIL